jgi:hypothetical protein
VTKAIGAFLERVPGVAVIPAYLVGVGARPERVGEFARRPPESVV